MKPTNEKGGYDVIQYSNWEILPVRELDKVSQKVVIFDYDVCNDN